MGEETCWKEVEARVHVSLSPHDLSTDAYAAASRLAFQSLLMRYNAELGGVAVAHRGGLKLCKRATFVGASPYAHLTATANLLVFAPPRGMVMVGVVTHVGPDHVALSVLQAFHAVLPLNPLKEFYAYDNRVGVGGLVRKWRALGRVKGFEEEVTLGRQIRFVVDGVKPTRSGLFQIQASLNSALGGEGKLGVLRREEEVVVAAEDLGSESAFRNENAGEEEEEEEEVRIEVMSAGRRSSVAKVRDGLGDVLGDRRFGDALGGGVGEKVRRKSVTFGGVENAKDEPDGVLADVEEAVPVLTQSERRETKEERRERRRRRKEEKEEKRRLKKKKRRRESEEKVEDRGGGANEDVKKEVANEVIKEEAASEDVKEETAKDHVEEKTGNEDVKKEAITPLRAMNGHANDDADGKNRETTGKSKEKTRGKKRKREDDTDGETGRKKKKKTLKEKEERRKEKERKKEKKQRREVEKLKRKSIDSIKTE